VPIRRTGRSRSTPADSASDASDPRLTGDHVRTIPRDGATVTLVGTVHDHPASVRRTKWVVAERDPAVLALELPPLALPLFEKLAAGRREGPDSAGSAGGEMAAAISAAATDRVVGIDGPSLGYARTIAAKLGDERPGRSALRGVLAGAASAGRQAIRCRLGATLASHTSRSPSVRNGVTHDCGPDDDPETQAADERRQIDRARAVMDAFEPSRAAQFRDETREAHMAARLRGLRGEGDVVAVVGHGHLTSLADRLG